MSNTIQFFAGVAPGLAAGNAYTLTVNQSFDDAPDAPSYSTTQDFWVTGSEFTLDPSLVQSFYPPSGGTDQYDAYIPYIALSDPFLPWERSIVPQSAPSAQPWLALIVLSVADLGSALDASTNSPLVTMSVNDLLTAGVSGSTTPSIPTAFVPPSVLQSQCQTLTISAATFTGVMPALGDLPYLAHTREMNVPGEPAGQVSVILGNRLPIAATSSPSGTEFYAFLVSLEGLDAVLTSPPTGNVTLVSLWSWSFVSQPEDTVSFEDLLAGLDASVTVNGGGLALPPPPSTTSATIAQQIAAGYVPLDFHAFASRTFAWYRGPFVAELPEPLPLDPLAVTSSDALLLYLADQAIFDASYAAAWNIGRSLALANSAFSGALLALRRAAAGALTTFAARRGLAHFAGVDDPRALLRPLASRRRFYALLDEGLAADWHHALRSAIRKTPPRLVPAPAPPPASSLGTLLADAALLEAILDAVAPQLAPILPFLGSLALLEGVPFCHLVPDQDMLPQESIRFFFVDPQWVAALLAGAASLGLHTSLDLALHTALWPRIAAAATGTVTPLLCGMLLRSQIVSDWAALNITSDATLVRDVQPAPAVRLCLFAGTPTYVTLAQPYHGLQFGVENGLNVRDVTPNDPLLGTPTGVVLPAQDATYATFAAAYCNANGVIQVGASLVPAVLSALGLPSIDAGDFAIQLVQTPYQQSFGTPPDQGADS